MARLSLAESLLHMPRLGKRALALSLDLVLSAAMVWLAWCLRLEEWLPLGRIDPRAVAGAWLLGLPVFVYFGLYAAIFRYAGWNAMLAVGKAVAIYGALYALVFTVVGVEGVPRSVGILQPLLMFVALGASRVAVRLWLGDLYRELLKRLRAPGVMIYGAGAAGRQLAASLLRMGEHRLVAFIDDDPVLQGRKLDGVPVVAPTSIGARVERHRVHQVLLAIPSATAARRKQIIEELRPHPVHVRTLPGLAELVNRGVSASDLHELDIEDLLGREPVQPDAALMERHLCAKTVLVTGAGGSIGSELCRQIVQWGPSSLLLLDSCEFALYEVHRELQALLLTLEAAGASPELVPLLGSVQDAARMDEVFSAWQPHIVYHAAAYKHVPLVEFNVCDGLRNNTWGTLNCARAAARHGVERFVLVSTDKAVRPTNVMGASKRLAEMVLQALAQERSEQGASTCFTMVRFGNVLGSSGSVVPLFRQQIAAGGPITLTHEDITRYFMTIPEAAQLVIQAGAMAQGGDVFVLDMGECVRIHDLACRMVELTGQRVRSEETPWGSIDIEITGLRPGEKLYEELLIGDNTSPTDHPRIQRAHERFLPWPELEQALGRLERHMRTRAHAEVRTSLMELVEGYAPSGDLLDRAHQARLSQRDRIPQATSSAAEPAAAA